jgi:hypothetical protein
VLTVDLEPTKEAFTFVIRHHPDRTPDVEEHKARLEKSALEKSFGRDVKLALKPLAGEDA